MSSKRAWPRWLPLPLAWFRAASLVSWLLLVGTVLQLDNFRQMLRAATTGHEHVMALAGELNHLLLFILYAYLHHGLFIVLNSEKSHYLPGHQSLWFGFYAWLVSTIAALLTAILLLPFQVFYQDLNQRILHEFAGVLSFVIMAYCYQIEQSIRQAAS
ncbi:MAG: hypothetical protein AAGF24_02270 [Cyanobacteria bacterium P01_H01_bin.121]